MPCNYPCNKQYKNLCFKAYTLSFIRLRSNRRNHASFSLPVTTHSILGRIRQGHIPDPKQLLPYHAPILLLINDPDVLHVLPHRDEQPPRRPQLLHQHLVRLLRRRPDVDRIPPSPAVIQTQPPVRLHDPHFPALEHLRAFLALRQVPVREVDETLDVVHAYDSPQRADEVGEDGGQVAGAGADVQDAGCGVEVGEEGLRR